MAQVYEIESQQDHPTYMTHSISPAMEMEFVVEHKNGRFLSVHDNGRVSFDEKMSSDVQEDWKQIETALQKIAESVNGDPDAGCHVCEYKRPFRFEEDVMRMHTQLTRPLGPLDQIQSVAFNLRVTGLREYTYETRYDGKRLFKMLYEVIPYIKEFQPGPKTVRTMAL